MTKNRQNAKKAKRGGGKGSARGDGYDVDRPATRVRAAAATAKTPVEFFRVLERTGAHAATADFFTEMLDQATTSVGAAFEDCPATVAAAEAIRRWTEQTSMKKRKAAARLWHAASSHAYRTLLDRERTKTEDTRSAAEDAMRISVDAATSLLRTHADGSACAWRALYDDAGAWEAIVDALGAIAPYEKARTLDDESFDTICEYIRILNGLAFAMEHVPPQLTQDILPLIGKICGTGDTTVAIQERIATVMWTPEIMSRIQAILFSPHAASFVRTLMAEKETAIAMAIYAVQLFLNISKSSGSVDERTTSLVEGAMAAASSGNIAAMQQFVAGDERLSGMAAMAMTFGTALASGGGEQTMASAAAAAIGGSASGYGAT